MDLEYAEAIEENQDGNTARLSIQRNLPCNTWNVNDSEIAQTYARRLGRRTSRCPDARKRSMPNPGGPAISPFFERNLEKIGGFSSIYFFEAYQNLALLSSGSSQ